MEKEAVKQESLNEQPIKPLHLNHDADDIYLFIRLFV